MDNQIEKSREIINKAITDFKPKAIVMMLSGGDDSITAYSVSKRLGVKFDYIIHGRTGTGIDQTFDFVKGVCKNNNEKLLVADAGDSYVEYVKRKGFWGFGIKAHALSYQLLKATPFRKVVSKYLRHGQRDYPVLLINGARRLESENRKKTMVFPYRRDPAAKTNIWVNAINDWGNHETVDYLEGEGIERNPVSKILCRSGECYCGTLQTEGDYNEAKYHFPCWGKKMDAIRESVKGQFPWDWGKPIPKSWTLEKNGQGNLFTGFQPMCRGCKVNFEKNESIT